MKKRKQFWFMPQVSTLLKKEALVQVFSCEFCEIFKSTFFTEHLRATSSAITSTESSKNIIRE